MPELPEVETVKRGLERLIIGRSISDITSDTVRSFPNDPGLVAEFCVGAKVVGIRRRAKVLLIALSTGYSLMVHLKMTGQMVFVGKGTGSAAAQLEPAVDNEVRFGAGHPNESLIGKLPDTSTRVIVSFSDGSHLYFNDQRKFGWIKLLPDELVAQDPFMQKVGPEPLEAAFTDRVFIDRLMRRPNTSIKAALLDQSVLAGVGNIYADESLWGAKIHPARTVKTISKRQLKKLHAELLHVLQTAIDKGGSTDRNYVNAEGKKGSYITFARVFRRETQPCYTCGTIIIKTRVAGRGTHVCENCQRLTATDHRRVRA